MENYNTPEHREKKAGHAANMKSILNDPFDAALLLSVLHKNDGSGKCLLNVCVSGTVDETAELLINSMRSSKKFAMAVMGAAQGFAEMEVKSMFSELLKK